MYEKYKKLILEKIEREKLTEEFVTKTTTQIDYYLNKNKLTQKQYDDLITLMNPNDTEV